MGARIFQELQIWEELDDRNSELIVGGAVEKLGDNPYNGIPFTEIITPGQGRTDPNGNGWYQSVNAVPNAYGAPQVRNSPSL